MSSLYSNNAYQQSITFSFNALSPDLAVGDDNFVLASGIFSNKKGFLSNLPFNVVFVNPKNVRAAVALNHAAFAQDQANGKQNLIKRTYDEMFGMAHISVDKSESKQTATGGLLVGLTCNNYLLSIGGVVLIKDKKDAVKDGKNVTSRGNSFSLCPEDEQIVFNTAATHPAFEGYGLIQDLFVYRALTAHTVAKEFNRHCVTTKSANVSTQKFYINKLGLQQDGEAMHLSNVEEPDNMLMTLGGPVACVTAWLQKNSPDVLNKDFTLAQLSPDYFTPVFEMA